MTILYGLIGAGVIIGFARTTGQQASTGYYSTVLSVIALVYVLFAVMDGSPSVLWIESATALTFIMLSVAGSRVEKHAFWILAAGLVLHGAYDLVHEVIVSNRAVPVWWPVFCGVVDITLGLWTVRLAVHSSVSDDRSLDNRRNLRDSR